jgi:hypothetical protein
LDPSAPVNIDRFPLSFHPERFSRSLLALRASPLLSLMRIGESMDTGEYT